MHALAQLLHIPAVDCGILGSAIRMDKDMTKRLLIQAGVPVADYMTHYNIDPELNFAKVTSRLGKAIFIRPANMGSSVGMSKVSNAEEFARGMAEAHGYDNKVLLESAVTGSKVGCGVVSNNHPEASVFSDIKLGGNEFCTYEAKYSADSTTLMTIPADFTTEVSNKIRYAAILAYTALECRGFARVDPFLTNDGEVLVNEINTIPAFRIDSSYPKLWQATGLGLTELRVSFGRITPS
jgi:D-alanine-D-alanine ligase